MVLRYSYSDTKVLFTGDITAEEEQQLLEQNISADVLKVAHHGSKYSSDAAFLEKVSPKAAVISCGTNNVYGHPHKEAMERLQKTGAEIFRTDGGWNHPCDHRERWCNEHRNHDGKETVI